MVDNDLERRLEQEQDEREKERLRLKLEKVRRSVSILEAEVDVIKRAVGDEDGQ